MAMTLYARRISTLFLPTVASLGALCVAQTGVAHAADDASQKQAIVRLGVVFPPDSDKSAIHASLGLAYEFCKSRPDASAVFGVYGDYLFFSSKTIPLSGGDFIDSPSPSKSSGFDVGFSGRYRIHPKAAADPYVGIGAGVYGLDIQSNLADGPGSGETYFSVGGKVMAGVEFKSGFLGEVVYQFFPSSRGDTDHINVGGIGLNAGYHF